MHALHVTFPVCPLDQDCGSVRVMDQSTSVRPAETIRWSNRRTALCSLVSKSAISAASDIPGMGTRQRPMDRAAIVPSSSSVRSGASFGGADGSRPEHAHGGGRIGCSHTKIVRIDRAESRT